MNLQLIENINKFLGESVDSEKFYHGSAIKKTETFKEFDKKSFGYTNSMGRNQKIVREFIFLTNDKELADKFAIARKNSLEDQSGRLDFKKVILSVNVKKSKLKVLDLTDDEYEFNLQKIGIDPVEEFGMGMYDQTDMWTLLDDPAMVKIIKEHGFNAIELLEPSHTTNNNSSIGKSLAIFKDVADGIVEIVES
jgi:hypothetical protein